MEFTIEAAAHKKHMPAKEGFKPSQIIALRLTDGTTSHEAEWITATTTDADALVGTRISGTLEPSQYGMRFKEDRPAFAGGGGMRPRDPKDTASIVRQHSEHMAVLLLQVKATAGVLTDDDLKPAKIRSLTDWFDDDVAYGVERKHPSQRTVNGLPVHNEPTRTGAPDTVTPAADYPAPEPVADVPFGAGS
jgi:hypothetical protein